jgi:hypothetical protein
MHKAFTDHLRACALLPAGYGMYRPDNTVTRQPAAGGAAEFPFLPGQPRLAGSVQAIVNPVAIR